jgi:putative ABC transport system ATP-binding protein
MSNPDFCRDETEQLNVTKGPDQTAGRAVLAPEVLIQLTDVTKRYEGAGHPAVDDVSLSVESGEAVAVMGPSGNGKSTLLNLIAGLDKPTSRTVMVAGGRMDRMGETAVARFRRREIGMIFQFFNLLEDLTVQDNVLLAGVRRGRGRVSC